MFFSGLIMRDSFLDPNFIFVLMSLFAVPHLIIVSKKYYDFSKNKKKYSF